MDKFILIDGNSLINRAFYATKLLTTRDGTPTNGVFGFTKLLIKIITDLKPEYMVVAFDLKAPTFRHKIYDNYKGTRKPMPDELVVQMPIMKSLLSSMQIKMCEKEGLEADDIIGTLSRKFGKQVHNIIITGDRDSYQLINGNTDVYMTKTGVSELLKLTDKNFKETLGYEPRQVVDIKALMGDSSDNIPGVPGIGEKTALDLIGKYDNLDSIYENIENLKWSVQNKLTEGKESAYLSQTLARIETEADLNIELSECRIKMPFPAEAKEICFRLEFSSIMRMDIFAESEFEEKIKIEKAKPQIERIENVEAFIEKISAEKEISVYADQNGYAFYCGGKEYTAKIKKNLLDAGIDESDIVLIVGSVFSDPEKHIYVYGKKGLQHRLKNYGIDLIDNVEDVSILKYLTDYTGKDDDFGVTEQVYGLPEDTHAYNIYTLYNIFYKNLEKENLVSLYKDLELPLSDVLFDMEISGVKIDVGALSVFEKRYRDESEKVKEDIYRQAGKQFNLNSPAQLGKVLFDDLKIPSPKKSKAGKYSTGADILEKLAEDYTIVKDILRYRRIQKLLSTYIEGFRPLIDAASQRVHTNYNQIQTSTGRLSSTNPNLQNIPVRDDEGRELRKLFLSSENHVLLDADYSQIELRLLAHFSGCKELIEAYRRGDDIHALTASQVFDVPIEEVDSHMRRSAKAVNFGIIYGISDFGLAKNLDISPKRAGEYIKKYFETYSDVKNYMDSNVAFAKEHGFVTTILGRKRVINEIKSSNFNIRSFGERAAMNMPLQGSSADIIKVAMIRIYERLKKENLKSKLILQVHDELVIDTLVSEKEKVADILKFEMEHAADLRVPLIAEVHEGKNWYEAK